MEKKLVLLVVLAALFAAAFSGCSLLMPEPTPSPTIKPTATPTPKPTPAPTPAPPETLNDWYETVYKSVVMNHLQNKSQYVRMGFPAMEDFAGITVQIADIDLDGIPELFVGYAESGQMDILHGYYLYAVDDDKSLPRLLEKVTLTQKNGELSSMVTLDDRHLLYILEKDGQTQAGYYHIRNEGSYDYGAALDTWAVTDGALSVTPAYGAATPDKLTDKDPETIAAFLKDDFEAFLREQGFSIALLPVLTSGLIPSDSVEIEFTSIG